MVFIMLYLVVFFSGLYIFSSKREHFLSMLLSLEYMSLIIYLLFTVFMGHMDLFYPLFYITFTACEGAMGLSILVIMSRTHGGDYFKTLNL